MSQTIYELLGIPEDTPKEEVFRKTEELKAAYDKIREENFKDTRTWIAYQNKILALDDAYLEYQRREIDKIQKELFKH